MGTVECEENQEVEPNSSSKMKLVLIALSLAGTCSGLSFSKLQFLLGRGVAEAEQVLASQDIRVNGVRLGLIRVVKKDGEWGVVTQDVRTDRVNVEIRNNVVRKIIKIG